ncbi:MAG: hypothetical protein WCO49_19425 [Nostocales cyanobacterium ELA608]
MAYAQDGVRQIGRNEATDAPAASVAMRLGRARGFRGGDFQE